MKKSEHYSKCIRDIELGLDESRQNLVRAEKILTIFNEIRAALNIKKSD